MNIKLLLILALITSFGFFHTDSIQNDFPACAEIIEYTQDLSAENENKDNSNFANCSYPISNFSEMKPLYDLQYQLAHSIPSHKYSKQPQAPPFHI